MADTPLPKRDYNAPPPSNNLVSTATVPLVKPERLSRELVKIRRELLTLARRVEQLTTGQETA